MPSFWYQKNIIAYGLLPLSFLYRAVIVVRRFLYRARFKKTTQFKIPIIVVGNIAVGGTGKTPFVIWLANFLKQQGFKPGIVSRGYGGKAPQYPVAVNGYQNPKLVGDEALLLVRNTQCPMIVDPNRVPAVQKLLQENDCDVVISDDGLQHYALGRDIEVAIVDGDRRFGNGFCLPAGPLREPITRLNKVNFIVVNGQAQPYELQMKLVFRDFCQVINPAVTKSAENFKNKTMHAVAGIGNPARFFDLLRAMGLTMVEHVFPDHYLFQAKDLNFGQDAIVVMTEKDAVKCESFASENIWYLPVRAELPEQFKNNFLEQIKFNTHRNE